MFIDFNPVKVNVNVEPSQLDRNAFYSICLITENDFAPRTLQVTSLQDLLDNGFMRTDLAYDFSRIVLAQGTMDGIYIRSKRSSESYQEAFLVDQNSDYYFLTLDTKDITTIFEFNDFVNVQDEFKLQFFSLNEDVSLRVKDRKIVSYHYPFLVNSDTTTEEKFKNYYINKSYGFNTLPMFSDGFEDYFLFDQNNIALFDEDNKLLLEKQDMNKDESDKVLSAFPEAGWIARCGYKFPSLVQWLHKFIAKTESFKIKQIPNLSSTSVVIQGLRVVEGSGLTGQGVLIKEQVSLDWLKWAIQQNVWKLLYTSENINATQDGLQVVENALKEVLDIAVEQKIFSQYKITHKELDRNNNKASFKFSATLMQSILNAEVEGTVYH